MDTLQFTNDGRLLITPLGELAVGDVCCCPVIGFDLGFAWPSVMSCGTGMAAIINLAADVSRIGECRIVFCGFQSTFQSTAIHFAEADWPAVADYIAAGGRVWLNTENRLALSDLTTVTNFLSALGSGMSVVLDTLDGGCDTSAPLVAGAAAIAAGVALYDGLTSRVSGGTSVWKDRTTGTHPVVSAEQIGSGFLFVSGDSNNYFVCSGNHCEFTRRLWQYRNDQIL
jgi:hypothetical protein